MTPWHLLIALVALAPGSLLYWLAKRKSWRAVLITTAATLGVITVASLAAPYVAAALFAACAFNLLYWLPSIIAGYRRINDGAPVMILNFFGFLFIAPWIVALVWAAKPKTA